MKYFLFWIFPFWGLIVISCFKIEKENSNAIVIDYTGSKISVDQRIYILAPSYLNSSAAINNGHFEFVEPLMFNITNLEYDNMENVLYEAKNKVQPSNSFTGVTITFFNNQDSLNTITFLGKRNLDILENAIESKSGIDNSLSHSLIKGIKKYKYLYLEKHPPAVLDIEN